MGTEMQEQKLKEDLDFIKKFSGLDATDEIRIAEIKKLIPDSEGSLQPYMVYALIKGGFPYEDLLGEMRPGKPGLEDICHIAGAEELPYLVGAACAIIEEFYDEQQSVSDFLQCINYYTDLETVAREEAKYLLEGFNEIPEQMLQFVDFNAVGKFIVDQRGDFFQLPDEDFVVMYSGCPR